MCVFLARLVLLNEWWIANVAVVGSGKLWESDGKQRYTLVICVTSRGISCVYVRVMGVTWGTSLVKLVTN